MGNSQQPGQFYPVPLVPIQQSLSLPPLVVAGTVYPHDPAQKIHRIFSFQFFDDFVVFPLPVTYSLFAPTPSTQYPFFNRAISTSCLAMMSRSRSTSLNDLLVCSAAYGLPFFGSRASAPSSRYRVGAGREGPRSAGKKGPIIMKKKGPNTPAFSSYYLVKLGVAQPASSLMVSRFCPR